MDRVLTVSITGDEYLELLLDRLKVWAQDEDIIALYSDMYDRYIFSGVFENNTHSVMEIVDNDYINWCDVIDSDDERYKPAMEAYSDNESEFISDGHWYYLEAYNIDNGLMLVRC